MEENYYIQTYIPLDREDLELLGIDPEYWNDFEVINDAIHSMIYNKIDVE